MTPLLLWPLKFIISCGKSLWLPAPGATDDTSGVQSEGGYSPHSVCQLARLFRVSVGGFTFYTTYATVRCKRMYESARRPQAKSLTPRML